jgi:hypothetical protein
MPEGKELIINCQGVFLVPLDEDPVTGGAINNGMEVWVDFDLVSTALGIY